MKFNGVRQMLVSWFLVLGIILLVSLWVLPTFGDSLSHPRGGGETPSFMPVIIRQATSTPTVTPTPTVTTTPTTVPTPTTAPVPQFVTNVEIENAKCPVAAGFQPLNGNIYILNEFSSNVTVFRDRNIIGNVNIPPTDPNDPAGSWPVAFAADNDSTHVYVAAVHAGTARINNTTRLAVGERYYEPHGVVVNPVNNLIYVSDLDRAVQVFQGSTLLENVILSMPPESDAWFLDVVVDPNSGYIYTAGSEGLMYVIDGTEVIASYRLGYRVVDLAIDPVRGFIYAAHNEKNDEYHNNISIFDINTSTVKRFNTGLRSRTVAVDPNTGLAYVTNPGPDDNPDDDSVSILMGQTLVRNVTVGDLPWGVAVNPNTGYAFVTNRHDNSVTVLRNGSYITTILVQGINPFAVAVDTNTDDVYIANRGVENVLPLFDCRHASVTVLR